MGVDREGGCLDSEVKRYVEGQSVFGITGTLMFWSRPVSVRMIPPGPAPLRIVRFTTSSGIWIWSSAVLGAFPVPTVVVPCRYNFRWDGQSWARAAASR